MNSQDENAAGLILTGREEKRPGPGGLDEDGYDIFCDDLCGDCHAAFFLYALNIESCRWFPCF